ncbi:unnamed protein product [Pedinophyceae sp. YPF-701]|nr:unnamed protein product [Pedinophyceae sp. YPF-701]
MCDSSPRGAGTGQGASLWFLALPVDVLRSIFDRLERVDVARLASCSRDVALAVMQCHRRMWLIQPRWYLQMCVFVQHGHRTIRDLADRARELGMSREDLPCAVILSGIGAKLFDHEALQDPHALRQSVSTPPLTHVQRQGLLHTVTELYLQRWDRRSPLPPGMTGLQVLSLGTKFGGRFECVGSWLPPSSAQHVRMLQLDFNGALGVPGAPGSDPIRSLPAQMTSLQWIELRWYKLYWGWLPVSSRKHVRCLELRNVQLVDGIPEDMLESLELIVAEKCTLCSALLPPGWTETDPSRHAALLASKPIGPRPLESDCVPAGPVTVYAPAQALHDSALAAPDTPSSSW